nr:ATP-binding protein [Dendronalium sp. ChiSLP03b]MDZ8209197.1 ATP-binding protein [Dendronalium sp. ChiSLP03b]
MNEYLNKIKIISLISEKIKACSLSLKCVGLFGSFIKTNHFRDIDILIIVTSEQEIKASEQWMKDNIQSLLEYRLDIKYYAFDSFLKMIGNYESLVLSIAVEVELIVGNSIIEQELASLKRYLLERGINIDTNCNWRVKSKLINNILLEKNKSLRGFLISHLDLIENHNEEAKALLYSLTSIEEPYTRVACFKQVNKLLSSEEYRKQLNVSINDIINFSNQILANRKNYSLSEFEDYSNNDLCLNFIEILTKYPPDMWNNIEILFRKLIRDYNHFVRQKTVIFILNEMLPINSCLAYSLLVEGYYYEHKYWLMNNNYITPFISSDNFGIKNIILLIQGYLKNVDKDNKFFLYIQEFEKKIVIFSDVQESQKIDNIINLSEAITQLLPVINRKKTTDPKFYLCEVLDKGLSHYQKNTRWHSFFSVTPKPKFGLKQNKKQSLKFVVSNLTDSTIPGIDFEIQPSAEIEISTYWLPNNKTYKPREQYEFICSVKPLVARQIAISYKINGDFGKPIYISVDRTNPFIPHKPAFSAHFVGREKELQLIREEIHQQHFLLFGPRRIGKTSLLCQLKEEFIEGYLPIYKSLQEFKIADGMLLFDTLIEDIISELINLKNFPIKDLVVTDDKLNNLKSILKNDKLLLLIDEMDVGQEINNFAAFLEQMRAMMQQESFIRVIFSSGPFITQDLVNPKSPLFNMVKHISVNRLTLEDAEKLLRLAEDQDIILDKDIIEESLQWTGRLPLYLQILGDHIYQKLKDNSNKKVSQTILREIKQEMKLDVIEWERMWNVLSSLEKAVLAFYVYNNFLDIREIKEKIVNFSGQNISFTCIRQALKNLIWYGLLEENPNGGYNLTAVLVCDWLKINIYYPEEVQEFFINYRDGIK